MTDIYSQQRRNRRTTVLLMLVFFVLLLLLGLAIDLYAFLTFENFGFPVATTAVLVLASINGFSAYYYGDGLVLRSVGAKELEFKNLSHRRLHNVVTEMALASGLPMPRIFVLPEPAPNAFATGRGPERSSVVVTQGLLDMMTREELQAVVAHEMGHIKNLDVLTMTVVSVLFGAVAVLSQWAVRTWRYGGIARGRKRKNPFVLIGVVIFVLFSPLLSRIIAMAVSRSREYQADTSSAEFTRNPGALASALEKMARSPLVSSSAHRGTAHLFIVNPLGRRLDNKEGLLADIFSTHPPIEKRIARLKRMAYLKERGG